MRQSASLRGLGDWSAGFRVAMSPSTSRHMVVSIDFVKSDRNRQRSLDNAPEFIIVDEAHTAARPRGDHSGAQHQRYSLVRDLARDPQRHMVLATATPHSGIEESFRSLLGLVDPSFDVPERNRRGRPEGDASDLGVIRVFSNPGPDAEDRLRRLFSLLVKYATRDGQAMSEKDSLSDDGHPGDHPKTEA